MSSENNSEGNNEGDLAPQKVTQRIFKPGESFGSYNVVRCISSGLLANYYQMQHARSLEDVTVTVFHSRTTEDPKFLKRLRALEKQLNSFDHDGIPKIRECALLNDHHCMILDPVKGISLNRYFAVNGQPGKAGIGPEATSDLLARLLGLLGYAHAKGVEHRDMDSDLILVEEDGSLQILGLGLKAAMGRDLFESIVSASVSPLVSSKTVGRLNSFDMINPEYREGKAESHRVDLWAVGMIGYWLLTAKKASLNDLVLPTTFMEDLPLEWDHFFKKTLPRVPEDRYASCKVALVGLKKIYSTDAEDNDRAGLIQRQIDRIPVPKGIVARGELATRIYRLSLIGLIGLTLTALASFALIEAFNEPGEYRKVVASKLRSGQTPDIRMTLSPSVTRVEFKNTDSKFIATDGTLNLLVQPGAYDLEVSAPNHLSRTVSVEVKRGDPQDLRVTLRPKWSDLRIVSNPGVTVTTINGEGGKMVLGTTDEEGILNLETGVFSGSYTVVFEKPGYDTSRLEDQELSFGQATEIKTELTPKSSSLTIVSDPVGANVFIGGVELGVSPLRIENMKMDQIYEVRVTLPGYRDLQREIEMEPGEDRILELDPLKPLAGSVKLNVTIEGQAVEQMEGLRKDLQIELDGQTLAYRKELLDLSEGTHTIRLVHPIYASELVQFEVKDSQSGTLTIALGQLPATLAVQMDSSLDSRIFQNGKEVQLKQGTLSIPSGKNVEVEVRTPNYFSVKKSFQLEPKERAVWKVAPARIPGPEKGEVWAVPYLGIEMVWAQAGQFVLGSPMEEHGRLPNEGPLTEVTFTQGYWIGKFEVTQNQYRSIMRLNPSEFKGGLRPVDSVTWEEANTFCENLNRIESAAGRLPQGYVYRLPTEPEWEYAAEAGTLTPFHFGSTANSSNANFKGVYPRERFEDLEATNVYGSVEVGKYQPNAWGLYDIHGNLQEWTLDRYNSRLPGNEVTDPSPQTAGSRVAVRGGSWQESAVWSRSAFRRELRPQTQSSATGFRIVLAPDL